ncbi:MAG: PDZ domain-containing protein [Pyrinomonadaceae bacterium]
MKPEPQLDPAHGSTAASNTSCPNCRAEMPREMRFCRLCGFRLGEGVAEYTETVRFQTPHAGASRPTQTADAARAAATSGPNDWSAMAHNANRQPADYTRAELGRWDDGRKRKRRRMHWFIWPILGLAIATASGGIIRTINIETSRPTIVQPEIEGSFIGADDFDERDGGVAFEVVTPPGSAADKAGLIGGDVITSFDGKPVRDVGDFMQLLSSTPAGKTVEVIFIRDGQTKTTKLTTISEDENARREDEFDNRPEGKGYIGEGTELERVAVPGTKIYGVRIDEIRKNLPGEIAGLRNGDIVIEFDGVPVRTRREFESRITRAMPGSIVQIIVMRGGERVEVPVKIGQKDND